MRYFFQESNQTAEHISQLYHVIWGISAGIWNLNKTKKELQAADPDATLESLSRKITHGSAIVGFTLKSPFMQSAWEGQKESIAELLLSTIIAAYEGWIHAIHCRFFGENYMDKSIFQQIHHSFQYSYVHPTCLKLYCSSESITYEALAAAYEPAVPSGKEKIPNLLKCFRHFKELRNAIIHSNGLATQRVVDTYKEYLNIMTPQDLGLKVAPIVYPVALNERIRLNLRGVVGLSDVIKNLIRLYEIELLCSQEADTELLSRLRQAATHPKSFSHTDSNVKREIHRYFNTCKLPKPCITEKLRDFFKQEILVRKEKPQDQATSATSA